MTKDENLEKVVVIKQDIINFLKVVYFGDISDPLVSASRRAYRDMNRTIRFNGLEESKRIELRKKINKLFKIELDNLLEKQNLSQKDFDEWHFNLSKEMKAIYSNEGIQFTYGHAQKWINMTFKYLYILEAYSFDGLFQYLHIPLDNYIFDAVENSFGIEKPKIPWSRWDDYENQYLAYQKCLRKRITDCEPLRWEFKNWLKEVTDKQ